MQSSIIPSRLQLAAVLFSAALAFGTAACGTHRELDESDDDENPAGRSSAGRGGRGGTGGGGAGGAGGNVAGSVKCGSKMCAPPANLLAGLPLGIPLPTACCANEATGQCGAQPMAGAACEPPAKVDARCPGVNLGGLADLAGGGMMIPADAMNGCCTPKNQCGLDGTLFGRGCVENSEVGAVLGVIPLIGPLIMVPQARACDAPPSDDADGGV